MWLVIAREPRPDAPYWPAALDAALWQLLWVVYSGGRPSRSGWWDRLSPPWLRFARCAVCTGRYGSTTATPSPLGGGAGWWLRCC